MSDDGDAEWVPQDEKKNKKSDDISLNSPSREQAKITKYFSSPSSKMSPMQQSDTTKNDSKTKRSSKETGSLVICLEMALDNSAAARATMADGSLESNTVKAPRKSITNTSADTSTNAMTEPKRTAGRYIGNGTVNATPKQRSQSPTVNNRTKEKKDTGSTTTSKQRSRSTSPTASIDCAAVNQKNIIRTPRRRSRSPAPGSAKQRNDNASTTTKRRNRRAGAAPADQFSNDDGAVRLDNIIHDDSRSRARRNNISRRTTNKPLAPKEPKSAYELFAQDVITQYKKESPNLSKSQLSENIQKEWEKKIQQEWEKNSGVRNQYKQKEEEDKDRHEMEVHQYNSILDDANISTQELVLQHGGDAAESNTIQQTTGLTPPSDAAAATAPPPKVSSAAIKETKPKTRTLGTQTQPPITNGKDESSSPPPPPVLTNVKHHWKPSQFQNKKRHQLLEQHRKLRRQKMAARRKGLAWALAPFEKYESDKQDDVGTAACNDWEVEKILGTREYFQDSEFLVHWKGKDPSWRSWETVAQVEQLVTGNGAMDNFWEQVRLFGEAERKRKLLMKDGLKELGWDEWRNSFSCVEDLEEIPLEDHLAKLKARTSQKASESAPEQSVPASKPNKREMIHGATTETITMELDMQSDELCPNDAETTTASSSTSDKPPPPPAITSKPAAITPASKPIDQEITNNTSSEERKRAAENTMMELDSRLEKPSPTDAETTTASAMDVDSQPGWYAQPESGVNQIQTTTVSTMTLVVGTIPNGETPNPFAAAVSEHNVSEGGGNSEAGTMSETETETTEPTAGSTTTDDTKRTPLAKLSMATFGHRESEWPEESLQVAANKASNAISAATAASGVVDLTTNMTTGKKATIPANIETKATSRTSAEKPEVIDLLLSTDDEAEDETPTTSNKSPVAAEVGSSGVNGRSIGAVDKTDDDDDILVLGVRNASDQHHQKRPIMNVVEPKHRKRRRTPRGENQWEDDRSSLFQVPTAHDMNIREVPRVHVNDVDAKRIVTEAREKGYPIVLTNVLGHPQFATRWMKRWNDTNRESGDDNFFLDGDPHSNQHEELLDLSQRHELDIERMIEDIGDESVPILKKNYSDTKPISKEILARNFLRSCWPRDGRQPEIKGLYLHQWQFTSSATAASKLCGHGNCRVIPHGIVGEDLLQFWLDGERENPYQYIFMGGADTFSKLHKDAGGLDITIAPIVGEKECAMVHRDDEQYLYGMKSKLDNPNLDKFPMMAHARVWKTVVKPGELLWMPAGTFHQCRNVTPCLSYHRMHLDTINLQLFFRSLYVGDAKEIQHDEAIWNCTSELINRVESFLVGYSQQPQEPVPHHVAEAATTLSHLRPLCREISLTFDDSCNQIHLLPANDLFAIKDVSKKLERAMNAQMWERIVDDIDLTLHDFNHRTWEEVPQYEDQKRPEKSVQKQSAKESREEIQRGLDQLEASRSTNKDDDRTTDTSGLQKLYDSLPVIQPFQEGVVISDSIQLKQNDKIIFRIDDKRCTGRIIKIQDQLRTVHLTYSRLPSYYDEYVPKEKVTAGQSLAGATLRNKQVFSAIGGKGKPVKATVQAIKVATFYLVRFSMDAKQSAKHERWLCRDLIIKKEG